MVNVYVYLNHLYGTCHSAQWREVNKEKQNGKNWAWWQLEGRD